VLHHVFVNLLIVVSEMHVYDRPTNENREILNIFFTNEMREKEINYLTIKGIR